MDKLTKKQKINVIRVLKKAKAYLDSPDKLVQDWGNFFEYKDGTQSGANSTLNKRKLQKVCRVCALGATVVARYNYKMDGRDDLAQEALEAAAYSFIGSWNYFSFGSKHSLEEVHDLYDRAIKHVENL